MLTATIHVNLKTISGSDQESAWLLSYCFFISKNEMYIYIYTVTIRLYILVGGFNPLKNMAAALIKGRAMAQHPHL